MATTERIILTGASAGIGRELALAYARRGARIVLVARRAELLASLAEEVATLGGLAVTIAGDVADADTSRRAVAEAIERFGGVDTVVMNAGRGGPMFVDAFDAAESLRVMGVNYAGVLWMLEAALPHMRRQGRGTLAAVTSLAGFRGMPGSGAYNASKAATAILMESIRTELRGTGINVVTIAPGFVRTAMTATNEFHMPLLMEPDDAARRIVRAIDARRSLYRFPLALSIAVRVLQWLPNAIFDRLIRWGRDRGKRIAAARR